MAEKGRKPIPKSQKEISKGLQDPYDKGRGNPNSDTGFNRGNETSFNGDSVKPFSIGIQDIDESIMYYFQNVIKPSVIQNGERINVPIIYGSPEKWKSVQKDGYYKDQKGMIMSPLIMFKRDSIEKVRSIGNKLDANGPNNIATFKKSYSPKNAYDNFSILTNSKPEKTNYAVVMSDYLTLTYSCVITTYYTDQLNKIIEAIEYASDSYWGDPSRFKFRAMIDSYDTLTELSDNDERIVRCNFQIKLNGYITPDVLQKDITAIKKYNDKNKIIISVSEDLGQTTSQVILRQNGGNFSSGGTPTAIPVVVQNSDGSYSVTTSTDLTLPDTTYNVYVNGVFNQSVTLVTLGNDTLNIYP